MDADVSSPANDNVHTRKCIEIRPSPQEYPKCAYINWEPPLPVSHEYDAIKDLRAARDEGPGFHDTHSYTLFDLHQFSIYQHGEAKYEDEFRPLSIWPTKSDKLVFSGILAHNGTQRYVQDVPIDEFSIEGYYDDEQPNVVVYARSKQARKYDVWYRLQRSAPEYEYIHSQFMWLAVFCKHVLDYLSSWPPSTVSLQLFRSDFDAWLTKRFGIHQDFKKWRSQYPSSDFRHAVNANIVLLYHQAYNLDEDLVSHTVWANCLRAGQTIEKHPMVRSKTVATPFVYDCFQHMYFGDHLEKVEPQTAVQERMESRKEGLGFESIPEPGEYIRPEFNGIIAVGDVISVSRDSESTWKTNDEEWLAYVQRTEITSKGRERLFVLWLYRPTDTTISTAFYPFEDELFFSNHCNCNEATLYPRDVTCKYTVDFPSRPAPDADYFVRQKYDTETNSFLTLKRKDFICDCSKAEHRRSWEAGECWYITSRKNEQSVLEPVVIAESTSGDEARVIRPVRLARDYGPLPKRIVPKNELAWTEDIVTIPTKRLVRTCNIRYFAEEDIAAGLVPVPYNRGGSGDHWVISTQVIVDREGSTRRLVAMESPPHPMIQGPDYSDVGNLSVPPLRGLSVFSGGGNLDRGLEEGGVVQFETAIDIEAPAIHTQLANARNPDRLNLYHGSINDFLYSVVNPRGEEKIAQIGEVDFVSAGSPCPPFSSLQPNWKSESSCQKASLVTTFCTLIDLYRPRYAIMENVVTMAATRDKGEARGNVLSAMIACLVSLGYQVSQFIMDAWSHGSCQSRTRLFLTIAAPGLTPMSKPPATHGHPSNINNRSLGILANSVRFGGRDLDCVTPFHYVTAAEGTQGLPESFASVSQICIPFPDHRGLSPFVYAARSLIRHIPRFPPGQSYKTTLERGLLPEHLQIRGRREAGTSWKRINPNGIIPTMTTYSSPDDSRCGGMLHWQEHRALTIQEAKRTQGIPDHEVIIGRQPSQWRVIGNAVDRFVALAMGLEIRRVWEASNKASSSSTHRVAETRKTIFSTKAIIQKTHAVRRTTTGETAIDRIGVRRETTLQEITVTPYRSAIPGSTPATAPQQRKKRRHTPQETTNPTVSSSASDIVPQQRKRRHTAHEPQHLTASSSASDIVKQPPHKRPRPNAAPKEKIIIDLCSDSESDIIRTPPKTPRPKLKNKAEPTLNAAEKSMSTSSDEIQEVGYRSTPRKSSSRVEDTAEDTIIVQPYRPRRTASTSTDELVGRMWRRGWGGRMG